MRLFVFSLTAALFATTASAEQVWVTMDQVKPYTFKQEVAQIVVGNPGIADVTVRDKSRVLLFGKAPGLTNMFLFDADGNEMENLIVRVRASNSDLLTLQRGGQRFTFNCTSTCEQTMTVGDSPEAFGAVQGQVQQKFQQASGSGAKSE
jgi:Flp pilus assembly secretin CpaC